MTLASILAMAVAAGASSAATAVLHGPILPRRKSGEVKNGPRAPHLRASTGIARWISAVLAVCVLSGQAAAQIRPLTLTPQQIVAIQATLAQAANEGFDPNEFDGQTSVTEAAIAYAEAEHGLRLAADRFPKDWAIRPAAYDARAEFEAAVADDRLELWLKSLPPPYPAYGRLIAVYGRYRRIAEQGGWPTRAKTARPGDVGEAVDALRRRLAVEDSAVARADASAPGSAYDQDLQAAVARAQARYGLTADGVAGRATLAALNITVEERLGQIKANLERWRWLPRWLPDYRAELNIADASLALYAPDEPVLSMRAVVGEPKKPTPMFEDHIKAVVFNPPWNVPADIAQSEIWPKIKKDPSYVAREHFVVLPDGALQQLPGPDCALGSIKFDLSNPFGVYLHDTPAKTLFSQDSRALSHGCMRLADPHALAKRLLQDDAQWPSSRIDVVLLSGQTTRAPLAQPVPLFVGYWTVFVTDDGAVNFRADVYHWDRQLLDLLSEAPGVEHPRLLATPPADSRRSWALRGEAVQ